MDDHKRLHSSALRRGRCSSPGQIYHITISTANRYPYFSDLMTARRVICSLRSAQSIGDAETLAYMLMPDHLHWLMRLGEQRSLSDVVGAVKSTSSRQTGVNLWQTGFHDHALRREENILPVARYIVANPLRSGLVRQLGDYPHWDSVWV